MKKLIDNENFRIFLKAAFITAICLALVAIGFIGAAIFSGGFDALGPNM